MQICHDISGFITCWLLEVVLEHLHGGHRHFRCPRRGVQVARSRTDCILNGRHLREAPAEIPPAEGRRWCDGAFFVAASTDDAASVSSSQRQEAARAITSSVDGTHASSAIRQRKPLRTVQNYRVLKLQDKQGKRSKSDHTELIYPFAILSIAGGDMYVL
jgi:hypothetical protein